MEIILIIGICLVGGVSGILYYRNQLQSSRLEVMRLEKSVEVFQQQVVGLEEALKSTEAEKYKLSESLAEVKARWEVETQAANEKIALLEEAKEKLSDSFKALSAEALKANNQAFLDLAKTSLGRFQESAQEDLDKRKQAIEHMMAPMQKSLDQFKDHIHLVEKARVGAFSGLEEQLKRITSVNLKLETETRNLAKALRTPHVRGQWGELQLKRTVELAGMVKYVDFSEQTTKKVDDKVQRPDMVIQLPSERTIVVDAKAPLMAYLEAVESVDPEKQKANLKQHAQQIRDHMTQLSSKQYWKQFDSAPEFVVLFLPGEAFFSAALEVDNRLIEFGADQRVILATPTTLIALLKAVACGWKESSVADEAQKISQLGRLLYERIGVLAGHFEDLRRGLERSVNSYNKAISSLESRVLPTARKFQELPVGSEKEVPLLNGVDALPSKPVAPELTIE